MAKGAMVVKVVRKDERYNILSFSWPLTEMDGWTEFFDEITAEHDNLQEQIDQIVAGEIGVHSWNGRDGVVVPEAGDYNAAQVGADIEGAAAIVQADLDTHKNDVADPHDTLLALQTFTATHNQYEFDTDTANHVINGTDIFLGLEVTEDFAIGDIIEMKAHLPLVTGSAGSTEVLFELIHDFGGTPTVIASEQIRVGNSTISVDVDMTELITVNLASGTIGLYGTAISGNTTVANDVLTAAMVSKKATNFSFKAYAP